VRPSPPGARRKPVAHSPWPRLGMRKRPGRCRGGRGRTTGGHRPQRCGTAADEDETFEGFALRGSGSIPSPSGTGCPAARRDRSGGRRLAVVKRSEPQVRYRDATSPESAVRRKPSRWCETTRTERDVVAWQPRPEGASFSLAASRCSASARQPRVARWVALREWTAAGCRRRGLRRIESEEDRVVWGPTARVRAGRRPPDHPVLRVRRPGGCKAALAAEQGAPNAR
jgi:hypothetical protein